MALHLHLPHRAAAGPAAPVDLPVLGARVFAVQRTGAVLVALFLLAFGLLGFAGGQGFFSTRTRPVLGMSTNGLLSTLSVFVAVVLLVAAARSPRTASTVMLVLGGLFLLSALVNSWVLGTRLNLLAFDVSNVLFSAAVGLPMLFLGAYGRFSGHLPSDSPYAHAPVHEEFLDERPGTAEEFAAERAMRAAEVAVVQHTATPDQRRRVQAMAQARSRAERRRTWMEFDEAADEPRPEPATPEALPWRLGRRRTG